MWYGINGNMLIPWCCVWILWWKAYDLLAEFVFFVLFRFFPRFHRLIRICAKICFSSLVFRVWTSFTKAPVEATTTKPTTTVTMWQMAFQFDRMCGNILTKRRLWANVTPSIPLIISSNLLARWKPYGNVSAVVYFQNSHISISNFHILVFCTQMEASNDYHLARKMLQFVFFLVFSVACMAVLIVDSVDVCWLDGCRWRRPLNRHHMCFVRCAMQFRSNMHSMHVIR